MFRLWCEWGITVCHRVLMMSVWRIFYWINLKSPDLCFSSYSRYFSDTCWILDIVRRNSVLVTIKDDKGWRSVWLKLSKWVHQSINRSIRTLLKGDRTVIWAGSLLAQWWYAMSINRLKSLEIVWKYLVLC